MSDHTDTDNDTKEPGASPEGLNPAGTPAPASDNTIPTVKLDEELKQSFINYAMSVIVDRALPDVRDGLKPVHRRVLYDMHDLKVASSGQTKKSARIVGDVIGRFHPHGDVSVYDAMVRMAQWFAMREPLVHGQGNFGDIDGDGAAAMRYTEVKMTRLAELMMKDMDCDTVDMLPNYDGNELMPEVLPTRFPNLLVNGATGIAVGMATSIPCHNLREVVDATLAVLDKPEITLDELMTLLPGPDFPTGGIIVGHAGIRQAYETGRGRCVIRARTRIETDKRGHTTIYVDEIPYNVHKVDIVTQIAHLIGTSTRSTSRKAETAPGRRIEGIREVNDLSDKDYKVRIAIELRNDAHPEAVLNNLFQETALQSSFPINMVALVNNRPETLPLKRILEEFITFRREVTTRRTVFLLRRDRRQAHLNEGFIIAKANIQRVISLITASDSPEDARNRLMAEAWDGGEIEPLLERTPEGLNIALPQGIPDDRGPHDGHYFLSREQADAILAMPLSRLTHLEHDKIRQNYTALVGNIRNYLEILNNPERMRQEIRTDLLDVREKYGSDRITSFMDDPGDFNREDLIPPANVIVTLSEHGYIKYQDVATYASQRRGGQGRQIARITRSGVEDNEDEHDYVASVLTANTHDWLICMSSLGRVFVLPVYELPAVERAQARGRPIQNFMELAIDKEPKESITVMMPLARGEERSNLYIFIATARGLVKKVALSSLKSLFRRGTSLQRRGIKLMTLTEGDKLIGAALTTGDDDIYLFTSNGRGLRFCEFYSSPQANPGPDAANGEIEPDGQPGESGEEAGVSDNEPADNEPADNEPADSDLADDELADDELADDEREDEDTDSEEREADSNDGDADAGDEEEADNTAAPAGSTPVNRHSGSGVRATGRGGFGFCGIKLRGAEARVVSLIAVRADDPEHDCLIATVDGIGKRMDLTTITLRNRRTQGMKVMPAGTEVSGVVRVGKGSEFMLVTNTGRMIRSPADEMRLLSRQARGVKLINNMGEHEQVSALRGISADVAEQARLDHEARQSERRLEEGLEPAPTAPEGPDTGVNTATPEGMNAAAGTEPPITDAGVTDAGVTDAGVKVPAGETADAPIAAPAGEDGAVPGTPESEAPDGTPEHDPAAD